MGYPFPLRLAVRSLSRSPGFVAVAALTLALGIGATTALFSVAYGVLRRPLPYPDPESLVVVEGTRAFAGEQRPQSFSALDIPTWQAARSFKSLAGYVELAQALDTRDVVEPAVDVAVSGSFFETLGARPLAGRWLGPADDASPAAVISHRLWQRLFEGRADAIGQAISLGNRPYTVVGVAGPDFRFPSDKVDVWTPMGEAERSGVAPWLGFEKSGGVSFIARLMDRVTAVQASAELESIGRPTGLVPAVTPLAEAATAGVGPALRLLLGAVGLVLLVAAANVANLMLMRYAARERELAIHHALGASRRRLLTQVLLESALIGTAGCAGGVLLADSLVRLLVWWEPQQLPRLDAIQVDAPVLAFAVTIGLLATLVASLAPALQSSRQDAAAALGSGTRVAGASHSARLRAVFVCGELAVSILLLVGASVLTRSLVQLLRVDSGARTEGVVTARLDLSLGRSLDENQQRQLGQALVERSRQIPGVSAAALGTALPPNGRMVQFTLKDVPTDRGVIAEYAAIAAPATPDFFSMLGIPLVEGRTFDDRDDATRPRVAVVSADVARDLFGDRALGRTLSLPTKGGVASVTVVGVVGNVKYRGLVKSAEPTLYVPFAQQPWSTAFLLVRSEADTGTIVARLRQTISSVDRRIGVVNIRPLADVRAQEAASPAFRAALLWAITGTSLLLAAVGLAGVVGYSVERRTTEIGVRMALGASPGLVSRMVLREALGLAAVGGVAGLAVATAATRVLSGFVFGVTPGDPLSFAAAGLLFALVIVVAGARPAWRASHVDPIEALRAQ